MANDERELNPAPEQGLKSRSIFGMFEVVSVAPTHIPKRLDDQIKIYTNSTTYRLYWYDHEAGVWHYVTATA